MLFLMLFNMCLMALHKTVLFLQKSKIPKYLLLGLLNNFTLKITVLKRYKWILMHGNHFKTTITTITTKYYNLYLIYVFGVQSVIHPPITEQEVQLSIKT